MIKRSQRSRERAAAEAQVIAVVRPQVVARDGYCRLVRNPLTREAIWARFGKCEGPSEWAHLKRRSATRRKPPEERHTTTHSCMLCRKHHSMEERHVMDVEYWDEERGADDRLRFIHRDNGTYDEP